MLFPILRPNINFLSATECIDDINVIFTVAPLSAIAV